MQRVRRHSLIAENVVIAGVFVFVSVKVLDRWIEQVVIIVTLLDHPDNDENYDIQEVLLDEEVSNGCTNARPVQSSVAVHGRVDGHHDV